jgi:hypothetical protein
MGRSKGIGFLEFFSLECTPRHLTGVSKHDSIEYLQQNRSCKCGNRAPLSLRHFEMAEPALGAGRDYLSTSIAIIIVQSAAPFACGINPLPSLFIDKKLRFLPYGYVARRIGTIKSTKNPPREKPVA